MTLLGWNSWPHIKRNSEKKRLLSLTLSVRNMRSSTFIFPDENIVSSLGIHWLHIAAVLEEKQTPEYLPRNGLHYKDMLDILSLCINKALCIIVCRAFLLEKKQKFKWHHEHWTHPTAMWDTASSEDDLNAWIFLWDKDELQRKEHLFDLEMYNKGLSFLICFEFANVAV